MKPSYSKRLIAVFVACSLVLGTLLSGLVLAQNKAEISAADLKARMVQMQKTIDDGARERARMTAELVKANSAAVKNTQTLKNVAVDQLEMSNAAAIKAEEMARQQADAQTKQEQLVDRTTAAAKDAKDAATSSHSQNTALLIVQSFMLLTLIITIGERVYNRNGDRQKEERDHEWQVAAAEREKGLASNVKKIYTLINGNYTRVLEDSLEAFKATVVSLRSNLVLLKSAPGTSEEDINAATIQIGATVSKVADLTKQLSERKQQTEDAAKQLIIDEARA